MSKLLRGYVLVRKGGPGYDRPEGLYMIEPHRDPIPTMDEAVETAHTIMEQDTRQRHCVRPVYVLKIICAVRVKPRPRDTEVVQLEGADIQIT